MCTFAASPQLQPPCFAWPLGSESAPCKMKNAVGPGGAPNLDRISQLPHNCFLFLSANRYAGTELAEPLIIP